LLNLDNTSILIKIGQKENDKDKLKPTPLSFQDA